MILYPSYYCKDIQEITDGFLKEHNIKGIILDVDNTLIDKDRIMPDKVIKWCNSKKENEFKIIILSNSIRTNKVASISKKLKVEYINFAKKPFRTGFKRALNRLNLTNTEVCVIGDQIFSDILGANLMKMYSILVEPLNSAEPFRVKWQRPIERLVLKKYLKNSKYPLDKQQKS
jgi:HAD superfamily phosphatase (TIGR01668 family)